MPFTIEETGTEGLGAAAFPAMAQRMKTLATNTASRGKKKSSKAPTKTKKDLWSFLKERVKKKSSKAPTKTKKDLWSFLKRGSTAKAAAKPASTASANIAARMSARMRTSKPKPAALTQTGIRRVGASSSFNLPRQIAGKPFPERPRAVVPQSIRAPLPMMGTPPLRSAVAFESIAKLFARKGAFVPAPPSQELIASLYGLDYPGQAFVESLTLPKKIMLGAGAVVGLIAIVLLASRMRSGGVSGIDAFTRKHYEDIAKILREGNASRSDVERWVEKFQADNPRFRADFFRAAVAVRKKDRSRH